MNKWADYFSNAITIIDFLVVYCYFGIVVDVIRDLNDKPGSLPGL